MPWWVEPFYDACMLLTLAYASVAGGWAERTAAGVNVVASVASWFAMTDPYHAFRSQEVLTCLIDACAALAFMTIMLRSRRFWPMWAFGCAVAGTMATVARAMVPEAGFLAYFTTEAIWPFGVMLAIVSGVAARRRPWMLVPI